MRRTVLLVTIVLIAVAAVAALATSTTAGPRARTARIKDVPAFLFGTIGEGHLRGDIVAAQRTAAPRAGVFVSLHGLTPSSSYTGVLSATPCGRKVKRVLDLMGVVNTAAGEDDFFANKTGKLDAKLARGKSFHLSRGGSELVCVKALRVR